MLLTGALVVYLLGSLLRFAVDDHPLSFVDEHVHLDTQFKVHEGSYPHRGAVYGEALIREWACGAGHQAGPPLVPCSDPTLGPEDLPSGQYTSGYIHYPTYFLGGEAFRRVVEVAAGPRYPLDVYRAYAAVVLALGVALCGALAWRLLRLRGAALVAATLVPVASSQFLMFGTLVNPMASAVLAGALIAGAGLRWVLSGRGYWWLVAATAAAAGVAVTNSLPAGAFVIAIVAAIVLRRVGRNVDTRWRPRWWHAAVLAAVLVAPIAVFGQVNSRRATVSNGTLYGFYDFDSWTSVLVGAVRELATFHGPWLEVEVLNAAEGDTVTRFVRALGYGIPLWVTIVVVGSIVLGAFTRPRAVEPGATADAAQTAHIAVAATGGRPASALAVLAASTLAAVVLYPPAMRISNALTMGFDNGVVARYTMAFTPLLVWLALLVTQDRPGIARVLAVLGTVGLLSVGATAW